MTPIIIKIKCSTYYTSADVAVTSSTYVNGVYNDEGLTLDCTITDIYETVTVTWTTDASGVTFTRYTDFNATVDDYNIHNSTLILSTLSDFVEGTATITCSTSIGDPITPYNGEFEVQVFVPGQLLHFRFNE